MTDKSNAPRIDALRALQESFDHQRRARLVNPGQGSPGHPGFAHADAQAIPQDWQDQPFDDRADCPDPRTQPGSGPRSAYQAGARAGARPAAGKRRKFAHRARDLSAAAWWKIRGGFHRPLVRKIIVGVGSTLAVMVVGCAVFWWRLASGPIEIDLATPWITSAIEQNFGNSHKVEVGGTQIERDEAGHTSLRIRDIIVRDLDGAIVASAPKAEVAVSGTSLLMGDLRATRVSLVGAELAVRIEQDGQVTVSTGAERRPLAVTPVIARPQTSLPASRFPQGGQPNAGSNTPTPPQAAAAAAMLSGAEKFTSLLSWIDRIGASGFDGQGLGEVGLKSGNLVVDDLRTGRKWEFRDINFSVNRQRRGGVIISLGSDNTQRQWLMTAAITPSGYQRRAIQIEARRVLAKDILLALRLDEGQLQADVPLSAVLRAEIGPDSLPQTLEGRVIAEAGTFGTLDDPENAFGIDKAEFTIDWDATRKTLIMPVQVVAGGNRITLLNQFEAPREDGAPWRMTTTGGAMVLATRQNESDPLVLNRILVRAHLDLATKRLIIDQGEIGGKDLSLALSGNLDYSTGEPRLAGGLAGTQMTGLSAKRIWPAFVAPKVRNWVLDHFQSGTVERLVIAANAPADTLREAGPPIPDDGLSVEVVVTNGVIQPLSTLPAIREADITTRITGRTATISIGRGTIELPSGRKLTVTNGVFEVPDTFPKGPPARARFRIDGPVQAAAELLAFDQLRDAASMPLDASTSRGNVSGQVTLGMPLTKNPPEGSTTYAVNVDLTNFGADGMMMGQKIESANLKVAATPQGYQIKGDIKVNGTPAAFEYRKTRADNDAEIRLQMTLDDAARNRFGMDTGGALTGAIPAKLTGRMTGDQETRFTVDADLTQAKITNLLPGWVKTPGKSARASFTLVDKGQGKRFEDIIIDSAGVQVKGNIQFSDSGDLVAANFPVFTLSDGDRTSLRADRSPDGALRVIMRGDVYDGRAFIKSMLATSSAADQRSKFALDDVDIDAKLGAVAGFNGEALRGLDLKMSRRAGTIRGLTVSAKIGRDTPLIADIRTRNDQQRGGRPVVYMETADAGALFRFTDMYPRMVGGQMWLALDPPTKDQAPQDGILNIKDFAVKGEAALDRIASQGQQQGGAAPGNGVEFSRLRVEFTRAPGRVSFRDGVVRGPALGATLDGTIDYAKNDVHMRGTFVPLYGLNNAFGQIPIVGLFLGGSNEGLLGVTYEVVGPPGAPVLRVNPISAVAPGLLRKFFEFPGERMSPAQGYQSGSSDRIQ